MKKINRICGLFLIGFLGLGGSQLLAQTHTMRDVFTAMPDSLLPLLTKNNRMDMMDFKDNHMEARVENRLGTQTYMDTITVDYLKVRLTDNAMVEMKLLPTNNDEQVIAVIYTVNGPAPDSRIVFNTTDWKGLSQSDYYKQPSWESYRNKSLEEMTFDEQQLIRQLDMEMLVMKFVPDSNDLMISRSTAQLAREEAVKVNLLLHPIVLKWSRDKGYKD